MNKINWKSVLPHVIAVVLFLVISLAYNSALLNGNRLVSHDDTMYQGAAKEIQDHRQKEGEEALWTNNMFSGMPAYTISYAPSNNWLGKIFSSIITIIPLPASHFFWAMLCFYIMLCTFGFKPYASFIGAVAYGFCSYNIGIITAGHYAKMWAIAFFPLIIGGINLIFRKKYLWGTLVAGIAMNFEILVNHPQMTYYYFVFFLSLFMIYLFVEALVKREIKHAFIASALTVLAIGVGVLANSNKLLPTQEYTKYSTRGKSDLKQNAEVSDQTSGLDRSYIVAYSSGKDDVYSFLVPNYKGYNSGTRLVDDKTALEVIGKDRRKMEETEIALANSAGVIFSTYWGDTDLAAGGVYSSVIIFALFLLAFIFVKKPVKWIFIPAFLVTVMLSWGKNYMGFTNIFIDNFPMYNKFRAVNSIIVVAAFCVPLLASFLIARLINEPEFLEKNVTQKFKNKHLLVAGLGAILVTLLLMFATPTLFQSFLKAKATVDQAGNVISESTLITEMVKAQGGGEKDAYNIISTIEKARIAIFRADVLRSFLFLLVASVFIALYAFRKIKWPVMIGALAVLVLVDVWSYDARFLNKDTKSGDEKIFQPVTTVSKKFKPSVADQSILNDPSLHKRVLNISRGVSAFNDGTTSYYHQSIGGYSGAKLKKYQELIERGIYPDLNKVFSGDQSKMDSLMSTAGVLNMLNTKYFIYDPEAPPIPNRHANGAAWTVGNVRVVADADAEIGALKDLNTKTTVVMTKEFEGKANLQSIRPDSTASIKITSLSPRVLEYEFNSSKDQLAVFSEIYYPAGWKATIDGNPAEILRVNYVLRALSVPKGKHTISFVFEPESFRKGELYSMIANFILLLILAGAVIVEVRKQKQQPHP